MEATISCDAFVSGLSVMSDGDDVLLFAHKGISIRLDRESALELAERIHEILDFDDFWSRHESP
jgi:hypothetical protein